MKASSNLPASHVNLTIADELANSGPDVAGALAILHREINSPLDRACELLVYEAVATAFSCAMKLLVKPNPLALAIQGEMHTLAEACRHLYKVNGLIDGYGHSKRGLKAFPVWGSFSKAGNESADTCTGARAAQGINIGLAWIEQKKMAPGYMRRIAATIPEVDFSVEELRDEISLPASERNAKFNWLAQFEAFLPVFRKAFDEHPHAPPKKKTFEEKAVSEWKGRAAFVSYRRRAAVLDKFCMSRRQIALACKSRGHGGFTSYKEHKVAMWLIGMSGLNTQTVPRILIANGSTHARIDEDWVAIYDAETGLLLRDFASLAEDAASASGICAEPASYVFALPAPADVAEFIRQLLSKNRTAKDFGELIPQLEQLLPEWPLYPSVDSLTPSWAKWAKSLGPFARQLAIDNLIAALLVGDLGLTAKSKLYYARILYKEIWQAAAVLYRALGWGDPVQETEQMAFGASVIPSTTTLREIDSANLRSLASQQPGNRSCVAADIAFHNTYVIALAFRIMIRLALRAANPFPLYADIDTRNDLTIDLVEKASAGRVGGIAAILSLELKTEIDAFRKHCAAMRKRLSHKYFRGTGLQWLKDVADSKNVLLLARISENGTPEFLNTELVLDALSSDLQLAKDFGRKWLENAMRLQGRKTNDIDRGLRHEVLGQETTTSVSESCERTWVRRMGSNLDRLHREIFAKPLAGLWSK